MVYTTEIETETETERQYSIRELSELTGVNAVTLRAWERRYGLLKPNRTGKGHRFYTDEHLDTVRKTLLWLDRGVAISKVRPLLENQEGEESDSEASSHWQELIQQTMGIVEKFQRQRLEQFFDELFSMYPLETLASNFFPVILDALNRKSHLHFGGISEQLFFSSELHGELLSRIRHLNANNHGDTLLLLNLDTQQLPVNILIVGLAVVEAGLRLQLLLEACPLREIPVIVEKSAVTAVICHSDSKPSLPLLEQEIARAAQHARVPFLVAGEWLDVMPSLMQIHGVTAVGKPLRQSIMTIQNSLAGQHV